MKLPHPAPEQIDLSAVLAVLGDPTRLAIIRFLDCHDGTAMACGQLLDFGSKTSLTYHIGKLREAGVVRVEPRGTRRLVSLRRADLDARFPGLMESVLRATDADRAEPTA